jgi:hypothetical protein
MTETETTTTAETLTAAIFDAWEGSWDGAEYEDGAVTWRVKVEGDDVPAMELLADCDGNGQLAWPEVDRDTGQERRPRGFDGAARKLNPMGWAWGQGTGSVWWQPPTREEFTGDLDMLEEYVTRLLADGFVGVVLERCEGRDAYGRPIVTDVASLWGIDADVWSTDGAEYCREILGELVAEIMAEREEVTR